MASAGGDAISLTSSNARAVVTLTVSHTMTSSTPFFDAGTGQMTTTMTAAEPERRYNLHSGSTSDGAFALDLTALDPATGRLDELGSVSVRHGVLVASDRDRRAISGTQMGLHVALGTSSADPLSVMGGLVADRLPVVGDQTARGAAQAGVTSVATSGALTTVTTQTLDSSPGATSTIQRRVYQHRNRKYVLQELSVDATDNTSGEQVSRQVKLRFSSVTWSPTLEVAVMSASTALTSPLGWGDGANTDVIPPAPCVDTEERPCELPVDPWGGGTSSGCTTPQLTPTGANIVYVHGISSTGDAWGSPTTDNVVRGKNRCDLVIAGDIAPSLTLGGLKGYGRHAQQATQLRADVLTSGLDNLIFVGHSQGGLISRRVAQSLQGVAGAPALQGVVTTGTPHLGANIANNLSLLGIPRRIARTFGGGFACRVTTQCQLLVQAANDLQDSLPDAVLSSDAMLDLRPSSLAIQEVNARPEAFRRFGIQNALTSHGFLFYQVAGDAMAGNKGRTVREIATAVSIVALSTAIIGAVVSVFAPWAAVAASAAAAVFAAIVGADLAWSRLTFGGQPSDGVVELPSQVYPGVGTSEFSLVNRLSDNPSSHTAQIDSERSAEDIQVTLAGPGLGVARRR